MPTEREPVTKTGIARIEKELLQGCFQPATYAVWRKASGSEVDVMWMTMMNTSAVDVVGGRSLC